MTAVLMLIIIPAAACSSTADLILSSTSTVADSAVTTTTMAPLPPTTSSTTPPPPEDPETGDIDAVARAAIIDVPGYTSVSGSNDQTTDLLASLNPWFPSQITAGVAAALRQDEAGNHIAVFSAIPLSGIRGYPWIAYLYGTWIDETIVVPRSSAEIVEVHPVTGGTFYLWGEGDGVMIATSSASEAAVAYLEARASVDTPNRVWSTGDCIFLPQDQLDYYGNAPWAPVALDIVVPCTGPHNGEVLLSEQVGVELDDFDAARIAYDRSYACDKAYNTTFGRSQGEYLPSLIMYMPDREEWKRGDRYIACVVVLPEIDGSERTVTGPFAAEPDLDLVRTTGDCTSSYTTLVVSCDTRHLYQYVGSLEYDGSTFPDLSGSAFDDVCASLPVTFNDGDNPVAEVSVVGLDLGPYQFEQGDRTVHCYALASVAGEPVEVVGSFLDTWFIPGRGGSLA